MLETVVMLAIITAISAQVLVSFTGLNEGAALQRSSRELALALRQAQNMAIAVTEVPGTAIIPQAVGVQLSITGIQSQQYVLFADIVRDNQFDRTPGDDINIPGGERIFGRGVRIVSLVDAQNTHYAKLHFVFASPEATMTVCCDSGDSPLAADPFTIELKAPSGQTKKIIIRTSGQISIK